MSISTTISLRQHAYKSGDPVKSSLDLSKHIWNSNGVISLSETDTDFFTGAIDVQLNGTLLSANLGNNKTRTDIDLNLFVANENGSLVFHKPSESLLLSGCCYLLEGKNKLQGLCMGLDGKYHFSEIDLDKHYKNSNGSFATGEDFSHSANYSYIKVSSKQVLLYAELHGKTFWREEDFYYLDEVDLAHNILIRNGEFRYEEQIRPYEPVPSVRIHPVSAPVSSLAMQLEDLLAPLSKLPIATSVGIVAEKQIAEGIEDPNVDEFDE
ncbi:hypothetical protein E4U42_004408, partial [Claviceps africana]